MNEELSVQGQSEEHRLEVANFPVTRTGDLIGTIGFGALIALGGVPCIVLNLSDPVIVIVSFIPILFGLGWIYATWRNWKMWRVFHPFEVRVTPPQIAFGEEVQVECRFTPKTNIDIEEINLSLRVTRITMERIRSGSSVGVPRPVLLNEESVRVIKNIHVKKGEEVRVSELFGPNPDFPRSVVSIEEAGETIVWEGHASVKVKGLKKMEAGVGLEVIQQAL